MSRRSGARATDSGIEAKGEWLAGRLRTTNLFRGVAAYASRIIRSCNAGGTVWSSVVRMNRQFFYLALGGDPRTLAAEAARLVERPVVMGWRALFGDIPHLGRTAFATGHLRRSVPVSCVKHRVRLCAAGFADRSPWPGDCVRRLR